MIATIVDNSVIVCNEIINVTDSVSTNVTNTISTNVASTVSINSDNKELDTIYRFLYFVHALISKYKKYFVSL